MTTEQEQVPFFLKAKNPVLFPDHPVLHYDNQKLQTFLKTVEPLQVEVNDGTKTNKNEEGNTGNVDVQGTDAAKLERELPIRSNDVKVDGGREQVEASGLSNTEDGVQKSDHPFIRALQSTHDVTDRDMSNITTTENGDLAFESTKSALADLFFELGNDIDSERLALLLDAAWRTDALMTLKIIFNARSIHLGKSSRVSLYKCFGWLAQNHPATLLTNLHWLTRPIIEKKVGASKEKEDDFVVVESENDKIDPSYYDQQNGVSHGYWKDLLNILVLAVEGQLREDANPKDILSLAKVEKKARTWEQAKAKEERQALQKSRHETAMQMFAEQPFYAALHIVVARLFADQLRLDLALLDKDEKRASRNISLCGKWAPTSTLFHDKHTFIVSTIAELLHPQAEFPESTDRETFLRHARDAYRKDISRLRKALGVVERDLAASTLENIKYERVPSLAMSQYTSKFIAKDPVRFEEYINQVVAGEQKISGATLLPSKLVAAARKPATPSQHQGRGVKGAIAEARNRIAEQAADGQWKALVQRVKDSGTMENAMAVCDVSGSMEWPNFPDGTCPMDSSIGLSLILSEVTKPPFAGTFITFSTQPEVVTIEGNTLQEKIFNMQRTNFGMSTDLVAVFEKLILPMAKKHKVKSEDMVKKVFVFSDMQFNVADSQSSQWSTSFERIKQEYSDAGYEMPEMVFWNLAGDHGYSESKPVTADEPGTSLVSGYSQAMMKVFLDNGAFEDPEAEEEIVEEEQILGEQKGVQNNDENDDDDDGIEVVRVSKKQKTDPMSTVRKAVSHKAYSMLKVVD